MMKKLLITFLAFSFLVSCKKEEIEEEKNGPDVCNCGLITSESYNQAQGTFSVSIESECSGTVCSFISDLYTYQNYSTGDRLCRNNVQPW